MKALFYNFKNKHFFLKEASIPKIKNEEVLVMVKTSSLCGSDLHIINGPLTKKAYNKKEIILGHSFSGVVEKIGPGVKGFKKGDRVFASNFIWCGKCQRCKNGKENLCDSRYVFGMEKQGSHAEYISVPRRVLFPLPKEIDFERGSLIADVLALCLHAIEKANLKKEEKIAILGLGSIGLCLGMILKDKNKIFVFDPLKQRQFLAGKLFSAEILSKKEERNNFDTVFEASGEKKSLDRGFKMLKRGGKIVLIGVQEGSYKLNAFKTISREISVLGVFNHSIKDIKSGLSLIKREKIDLKRIISHRFPLKEGTKAYNLLRKGAGSKIVFNIK